jgi:CheY-like chemotaxis protein
MEEYNLEAKIAEAQEPLEALADGVAYDLSNLLSAIRGRASLALHQIDPANPAHTCISKIFQYVDSGSKIIERLRVFSKTAEPYKQPVELNLLMNEILAHEFCRREGVVLNVDLVRQPVRVTADPEKIRPAVENLLDNAFKALPDGGVVTVMTEVFRLMNGSSEFYDLPPGEYVRLTVEDNGVGMTKDELKNIFVPFCSDGHEGRQKKKGKGLAYVREIIDNYGGTIEVGSTPGSGSAFSVYLPLENGKMETGVQSEQNPYPRSEKNTLLIVDDEQPILDLLEIMGQELGYEVLTALNGTQALQIYEKHWDQIMLVILDLDLSSGDGMDGSEVFDRLKAMDPKVNAMILTGSVMNGRIAKMLENGCRRCLFKPISLDDFAKVLSEVSSDCTLSL